MRKRSFSGMDPNHGLPKDSMTPDFMQMNPKPTEETVKGSLYWTNSASGIRPPHGFLLITTT
jgi:hypothetical protein